MTTDPTDVFERYRHFLQLLARVRTDPRFAGTVDLSGVVQQTLLEAHTAASDEWGDWSDAQRTAWLKRALANNLADEVRRYTAAARDVARQVPLTEVADGSAVGAGDWLAADHSSPSERAGRNEDLVRLATALAELPADQRLAVELHHLRGLSLADTASAMGRSPQSVVGLLFRGLRGLRGLLAA